MHLRSRPSELAIPVNPAREVHCSGNSQEAGNRANQKGVVLKPQQHIDEGVKEAEAKKGAEALNATVEDPSSVCREKNDRCTTSDQESEIKADSFGEREQQEIEDDLRDANQDVLGGMDALAGCHLKDEIGQKQQAQEEQHVLKRAVYGLVWVCQLNK